jgi:hypothetical protein
LLSPEQANDNNPDVSYNIDLASAVNLYDEFKVVGNSGNQGQFTILLNSPANSYGQPNTTKYYLTGSSNGKTIKWVNVSGNGSNGQV